MTSSAPRATNHASDKSVIFSPLMFTNLEVKNRSFRLNLSGMFDDYNGAGGNARISWEAKFAQGGVGAIVSSYTPVAVRGRILVRYAMIDDDDKIPSSAWWGNRCTGTTASSSCNSGIPAASRIWEASRACTSAA